MERDVRLGVKQNCNVGILANGMVNDVVEYYFISPEETFQMQESDTDYSAATKLCKPDKALVYFSNFKRS